VNLPELVRAELGRRSWKGEHVALGTNTDPYQWVERRYELMRGIWEAMRDYSNPCSILTKSPLLLRDIDLMKELCERTEFVANLSIPTLEEKAWRQTEPHTPHPRKRIEAIAELRRAGIPVGVLIAPLIPGVNDAPGQVEALAAEVGEAGAESIAGIGLHLRGEVRDIWFDWLRQYRPDLIPRYEELYRRGAYMPGEEREKLSRRARARARRPLRRLSVRRGEETDPARQAEPRPSKRPKQARLF
jgi:DNA repair photolyase